MQPHLFFDKSRYIKKSAEGRNPYDNDFLIENFIVIVIDT